MPKSTYILPALAILVTALSITSATGVAMAQTQPELDAIVKTCKLRKDQLLLKGDHVLLFASPTDTPEAMGCSRSELAKIPGAMQKLGVVLAGAHTTEAK